MGVPLGVKIISISEVIIGFFFLLVSMPQLLAKNFYEFSITFPFALFILIGKNTWKLRNSARKITFFIILVCFFAIFWFFANTFQGQFFSTLTFTIILSLMIFFLPVFYLTRKKIREQFK